jgi:uncharacterized protein YcfL
MTRRPVALAALAALLLFAAPGCRGPHRAANRVEIVPEGTAEITVVNQGLQNRCTIRGSRAIYEDDILLGVVDLVSGVDRNKIYQYRFTWRDSDGINLEESAWDELHLKALEEHQVQGRATEPGATSGSFQVRYSRRGE